MVIEFLIDSGIGNRRNAPAWHLIHQAQMTLIGEIEQCAVWLEGMSIGDISDIIDQKAVGFAGPGVLEYDAADRIGRVAGDAGCLERLAVGPHGMGDELHDDGRPVRQGLVEDFNRAAAAIAWDVHGYVVQAGCCAGPVFSFVEKTCKRGFCGPCIDNLYVNCREIAKGRTC